MSSFAAFSSPLAVALAMFLGVLSPGYSHLARADGATPDGTLFAPAPVETKIPLVIMLDLDETVVGRAGLADYDNPLVQKVSFNPIRYRTNYEKKQREERSPEETPNEITVDPLSGLATAHLVLRPTIVRFLRGLAPLVRTGRVRLLITSANDPDRTSGVFQNLRIEDTSLPGLGAEYVSRDLFMADPKGLAKSTSMLRRSLKLDPRSPIVAVDNHPKGIILGDPQDEVLAVHGWEREPLRAWLHRDPSRFLEFLEADQRELTGVYQKLFARVAALRALSCARALTPAERAEVVAGH